MAGFTLTSLDAAGPSAGSGPISPPPAELHRRLAEAFMGWPLSWQLWQDVPNTPFGYPASGVAWSRGGTGTVTDRQGGRNIPFIWSEIDLRGFRVLSRYLCDTNPFAIGFLGNLVNYHVRKGYGWQACKRGAKKSPYPTVGKPADPLVAKAQTLLDQWRDLVKWPLKSRSAFKRWRRDGEVFGRFFDGGWKKLPQFRFVLAEQVGHPDGVIDGPEAFGLRTPEDDQAGPIEAYHVWSLEGGTYAGGWVDGREMVFAKANTDEEVKRGLPDFFPVQDMLDSTRQLLANMIATAVEQAKWAWREKFPTASASQVASLIPQLPTNAPGAAAPPWYAPQRQAPGGAHGGRVMRVEGNREFEPGPATSPSGWIEAEQAVLRGCGARWNFPEYFSGDASNNNFASALVSGSPFTVAVEGEQLAWGVFERDVALRVLDYATEAGLLSKDERDDLDVEVKAPAVVTPKPMEDTQRRQILNAAKVLSVPTWQQEEGYDPQHEAENFKAAEGGGPGDEGPGDPGGNDDGNPSPGGGGDTLGDLLGEQIDPLTGAVRWYTERQHDLMHEAARQGLSKKQITNKAGKKQTVYVANKPKTQAAPAATDSRTLPADHPHSDRAAEEVGRGQSPATLHKLKLVAAKAQLAVFDRVMALTPHMMPVVEAIFDTPGDVGKLGYDAKTAGVDNPHGADPIEASLGISTDMFCRLASKLGSHALVWAKAKLKGKKASAEQVADWLADTLEAVNKAVGSDAPIDRDVILEWVQSELRGEEVPVSESDAPGTHPPHPGLVFDPAKHRYVKPGGGSDETGGSPAKPTVTYPDGFKPPSAQNKPNPDAPNETRPTLTAAEAKAVHAYSDIKTFGPLNQALRTGKEPPKAGLGARLLGGADPAGVHAQLRAAFAKAPVLKDPVTLRRGITVDNPDAWGQYFEANAGKPIKLDGSYQSCSTGPGYSGNIKYTIAAVHGLDVMPYSKFPGENEVLLPHDSTYTVKSAKKVGNEWHVELEQHPPERG